MEMPNYVLRIEELVREPKNKSKVIFWLKIVAFAVIVISLLFFLVFGESPFKGTTIAVSSLLFTLFTVFSDKHYDVPSAMEIRFFDEYMDVYKGKRYYNRMVTRNDHNLIFYKDIKRCVYRESNHRINIFGVVDEIWKIYKSNGQLPSGPPKRKKGDTVCYFYIDPSQKEYIISEIEAHSPIKFTYEN